MTGKVKLKIVFFLLALVEKRSAVEIATQTDKVFELNTTSANVSKALILENAVSELCSKKNVDSSSQVSASEASIREQLIAASELLKIQAEKLYTEECKSKLKEFNSQLERIVAQVVTDQRPSTSISVKNDIKKIDTIDEDHITVID